MIFQNAVCASVRQEVRSSRRGRFRLTENVGILEDAFVVEILPPQIGRFCRTKVKKLPPNDEEIAMKK